MANYGLEEAGTCNMSTVMPQWRWSGTDAGALGLKGSRHVRWRLLEGSELVAGSARVEEKSERWDFLLQVNAQSRQCRVHLPPQSLRGITRVTSEVMQVPIA